MRLPACPRSAFRFYLTQGRNVTQYQLEDDFKWIAWQEHPSPLAQTSAGIWSPTTIPRSMWSTPYMVPALPGGLCTGAGRLHDALGPERIQLVQPGIHRDQHGPPGPVQSGRIRAETNFQVNPRLKLTLGVRIDRTGNPLCHNECFASYKGSFPSTATAYNATVNPGQ